MEEKCFYAIIHVRVFYDDPYNYYQKILGITDDRKRALQFADEFAKRIDEMGEIYFGEAMISICPFQVSRYYLQPFEDVKKEAVYYYDAETGDLEKTESYDKYKS